MMRSAALKARLAAGLFVSLLAHSGVAQQPRTAVPMKATSVTALDSVRRRYHDTLVMLRDTVASVRWSLEQFQRDLPSVSRETIYSRATVLVRRCQVTQGLMISTEPVFDPAKAPARPPRTRAGAASLTQAMRALRVSLDTACVRGFSPTGRGERADTLRAWAGFRGLQVEKALEKYEQAVSAFTGAADFHLEPVVRTH